MCGHGSKVFRSNIKMKGAKFENNESWEFERRLPSFLKGFTKLNTVEIPSTMIIQTMMTATFWVLVLQDLDNSALFFESFFLAIAVLLSVQ